ncbi:hypothetical protein AB1I62_04055 [Enterococcus sp. AN402]|uniref:MuF-C-terminal domain-containing protein n=1 Tax=Enterococcus sp. AN402 TaxID=3151386 RepID=UPI003459E8EE
MVAQSKNYDIIATIREYEDSVAMSDGERKTYLGVDKKIHLKDGDETVMSPSYEHHAQKCLEYLRFGNEITSVIKGNYNRTDALKICDTPELYVRAGFQQLPMLYTQRHARDAICAKTLDNPHKHGLSIEQLKRIPELLEKPVMLCDSPAREDSMLSVLCAVDSDRLPLIAAIRPDGHGHYKMENIETNFILAVYGRNNFHKYFENLITPEKVIYFNKERSQELNALAKLQLLRSYIIEPDLLNTIIRKPQCIVNLDKVKNTSPVLKDEAISMRQAGKQISKERGIYEKITDISDKLSPLR